MGNVGGERALRIGFVHVIPLMRLEKGDAGDYLNAEPRAVRVADYAHPIRPHPQRLDG